MNNNTKFHQLLSNLENDEKDKIVSILEFGSKKGLADSKLSDTDLLIITTAKANKYEVFDDIFKLEDKIFHWPHQRFTLFIEKHFLGSNDISGIHAIVLSEGELALGKLNKKARHHKSVFKSLRLRLLTMFFICEPILLYKLKKESVLLYGSDARDKIWLRDLSIVDRFRCFSISFLVLLMTPLSIFNPIKFKVWCFKAIKYNNSCIESYMQIALGNSNIGFEDLSLNQTAQELVKKFRYHPSEYKGSLVKLYFQSWLNLFSNAKFIWRNVSVLNNKIRVS